MTTGLGIAPLDGEGLTPASLRQILRGWWSSPGVVRGCGVDLTSGLTYTVHSGVAVVSRGDSDGYVICEVPLTTVATTAGPASGSRLDRVWVRQHDNTQGDADNRVEVGVTHGSAAASPSLPALPTGALELTRVLIPQGATATNAGSYQMDVLWAIPFGVPRGVIWHDQNTMNGLGDSRVGKVYVDSTGSFTLPTDRYLAFETQQCVSIGPNPSQSINTAKGTILVELQLDGNVIAGGELGFDTRWETHTWRHTPVNAIPAGTHTIAWRCSQRWGETAFYHFINGTWPGRIYLVQDMGMSA